MKFYLNNQQVQVEVSPTITRAKDGTLASASVVLKANNVKNPYAPMQSFRIETENTNNDIYYYVVNSDSVSIFSLDPLTYKHNLSLIDSRKLLSKHIVRNSSFSQPASKYKGSYFALTQTMIQTSSGSSTWKFQVGMQTGQNNAAIPLHIESKDRVRTSYLKFNIQLSTSKTNTFEAGNWEQVSNINDINDVLTQSARTGDLEIQTLVIYYKLNGQNMFQNINMADLGVITFNKPIELPIIKELIEQGANDIFIGTAYNNGYLEAFGKDIVFTPATYIAQNIKVPLVAMVQIEAVVEYYYNTAYDILNLLIKRQRQKTTSYQKNDLFVLPLSTDTGKKLELYNLLTTTIAPNFAFTQSTMYECVSEVFRLFDSFFTLDSNKCLEINYLNESSEMTITGKYSGAMTSLSEERYNNGVITYFQGAKPIISFPDNSSFGRLRSNALGVPKQDDHNFIVAHPIDTIIKVEAIITQVRMMNATITGNVILDITPYVVEESIWSILPTSVTFPYESNYLNKAQNNTVYYSKGSNSIQLAYFNQTYYGTTYFSYYQAVKSAVHRMAGVYGTATDVLPTGIQNIKPAEQDWLDIRMRIQYISTIDGRLKIESIVDKYDGEMLIDQSNGSIDLNKLGLNMLGTTLMMGEPSRNYTHEISSWENKIKEGQYFIENGEKWVANSVSYNVLNEHKIIGQISFVKNFNALSQRINLLREKRLSNISSELTLKSEDNYIEYIYYSTSNSNLPTKESIAYREGYIYQTIASTFDNNSSTYYTIDFALIYVAVSNYITDNGQQVLQNASNIYIPLVKYGAGNMICFEMSFNHPITAGNRTKASSGWFGSNNYYTDSVKYALEDGTLDKCDISLYQSSSDNIFSDEFPFIKTTDLPIQSSMTIYGYECYKQPNEVFSLNYQLCFLPIENRKDIDFIGSAFINDNAFINSKDLMNHKFYLHYTDSSSNFQYSILDTKGEGNRKSISSISIGNIGINGNSITFNFSATQNIKTWSICDENGNIYFASNNNNNGTNTTKVIYFIPRHNRI